MELQLKGYVVGPAWVSRAERRDSYIEVSCYLCHEPVFMEKVQVIMEDKKVKLSTPYPDYLFPGWQVICSMCAYNNNQKPRGYNRAGP